MRKWTGAVFGVVLLAGISPAHAQWAVIDVAAIARLTQQITTMAQQLTTLQEQLRQAQLRYQAITGDRGMENLLAGVNRNYLPGDWPSLMAAVNSSGGAYPALSSSVQGNLAANAVLTPSELSAASASEQAQLLADRQTVAMLEATVQQALATTSTRFASLQELISAIGTAQDQKASLDLTARINAEEGMLENDQTKLQVLYQAAQAERWADEQRTREQAIEGIGSLRTLPALGL